jgi:holo-[acyl-carrier protein] synthase
VFVFNENNQLVMLDRANGRLRRLFGDWVTVEGTLVDDDRLCLHVRREDRSQSLVLISLPSGTMQWERRLPHGLEVHQLVLSPDSFGCILGDGQQDDLLMIGNAPARSVRPARCAANESVVATAGNALASGPDGLRVLPTLQPAPGASLPCVEAVDGASLAEIAAATLPKLRWQGIGKGAYALARLHGALLVFARVEAAGDPVEVRIGDGEPAIELLGSDHPVPDARHAAAGAQWLVGGRIAPAPEQGSRKPPGWAWCVWRLRRPGCRPPACSSAPRAGPRPMAARAPGGCTRAGVRSSSGPDRHDHRHRHRSGGRLAHRWGLARHGEHFLSARLHPAERDYCLAARHPAERLAARWAAKEACMKALGTGWAKGVTFGDIALLADAQGVPRLCSRARRDAWPARSEPVRWHCSVSHSDGFAIATVILEGSGDPQPRALAGPAMPPAWSGHEPRPARAQTLPDGRAPGAQGGVWPRPAGRSSTSAPAIPSSRRRPSSPRRCARRCRRSASTPRWPAPRPCGARPATTSSGASVCAIDPDRQVLPAAGSKEAIFHLPLAFLDAGERPGYGDLWRPRLPGLPGRDAVRQRPRAAWWCSSRTGATASSSSACPRRCSRAPRSPG